mgnify:CR=1 FL=1
MAVVFAVDVSGSMTSEEILRLRAAMQAFSEKLAGRPASFARRLDAPERVVALSRTLGKTPVEVNDFPGFVSNRTTGSTGSRGRTARTNSFTCV